MSAFLGNIHYLLYDKIKFQSGFCDFLLDTVAKNQNNDKEIYNIIFEIELNTMKLKNDNLENIVDLSNIHGSLQNMIIDVEHRLAYIVDRFVKNEILSLEKIAEIAYEYGKKNKFIGEFTPIEVYTMITGKILNGMPCDRVQTLIDNDDNNVRWMDRIDIHQKFWSDLGRSSDEFYMIRSSIIRGLISGIDINFKEFENMEYILEKLA